MLIFLSEKTNFSLKKLSKATKAKKANEGQQRPAKSRTSNSLLLSLFNVKSSINVTMILKECVL